MKTKLVITLALSIFTLASNAQTEKGNFLIGGSIGYSTAKSSAGSSSQSHRSTAYTISPKIGYFIDNNFAIGTKLQYSANKSNYSNRNYQNGIPGEWTYNVDRTDSYGISPFVRYYVNITDILKFYGEFEMSFETGKSKSKNDKGEMITKDKFNNYRPAISPGLVLFPSKKWAIEFSFPLVSYEKRTFSRISGQEEKASTNSFNFGLNTFAPKLGLNYHF
ncbi:outer membrane beta-barrel protein [Pedobacter caeni]|uniref:Outer membrane protein beta-barrel domain-containing protein n=1 Tax=Pedobacter caeni TaxID=288992 RepID=A0A1M5H1Y4_9SPHI|nr:outer membrane beta-barrel protein [Pedobacter caeni]SHG09916.1 Outer membrane protein beta-barrel domain-containing protein [Pedobacter caeni]